MVLQPNRPRTLRGAALDRRTDGAVRRAPALAVLLLASAAALPAASQQLPPLGARNPQFAQAPLRPGAPPVPTPLVPIVPVVPQSISLEAGTGILVQFPRPVSTVLAAEPRIARVQPASPTSVFLMGADVGRTTVIATTADGELVAQYEVTVRPSFSAAAPAMPPVVGGQPQAGPVPVARPSPRMIENAIRSVIGGGSNVRITQAGNSIVLGGTVATASDAYRALTIAQSFAGDSTIVNNLAVLSSAQVNLRVRVAEISREVTRELGFNWAALGNLGNGWTIGVASALGVTGGGLFLPDARTPITTGAGTSLAAGAFRSQNFALDALIDLLARDQLVSILAEPNLTAQSGETASFLAGGEFPVPVNGGPNGQLTVEFRQYGVSLAFVPTVLSNDRLNLRVRPEVSELTDVGAVELPVGLLGTVRVPALTVRRAETTVELGSGQSFAIAGLLQRQVRQTEQGLPGLMDSVLGPLFRSDRFNRRETELVIIVTPFVVRPVSNQAQVAAPTDRFRPAIDLERILERRQIGRVSPARPGGPTGLDAGFIVE